jgi:F420-dependent oxidoreductase-like protein
MKVGIHVVAFDWHGGPARTAPMLVEIGRVTEQAGMDSLTLMDHYFQLEPSLGRAEEPMLEGYTTLGFLAAATSTVRLHLMVTGTMYRYPGLLAKIVSTLDVLSGGRATLGIGAGWYEREHRALGVPFPPTAERFERLEETLRIVLQMWSDENGPFEGRHYQLTETLNSPQSLQRPHPPIMIGGGGERRTLRLVAKYADCWNFYDPEGNLDTVRHKLEVLREHCRREGRDFDAIEKSVLWHGELPVGRERVPGFLAAMRSYVDLGITDVRLMPTGPDPAADIATMGEELMPELAELHPASSPPRINP